ncbi:MAG: hypothetical protein KME12_23130 [Trichocoleus desertorum ATA4-8-CV12]|jgi:hypothetical protein|nr:hypothetical protein [Trichocoleus desertorum ATA4-8-CV12]
MEYLIAGALLALVGTIALVVVAYRKGWLERISDKLLGSGETTGRERVEEFIRQGREVRAAIKAFADRYQDPDQMVLALKNLRFNEVERHVGEINTLVFDIDEASAEFKRSCNYAIALINKKSKLTPEKEEPAKSTTTKVEVQPQASQSSKKYDDATYYAYRQAGATNVSFASGAQLNDLIRKGSVDGRDFFVVGLASEFNGTSQ